MPRSKKRSKKTKKSSNTSKLLGLIVAFMLIALLSIYLNDQEAITPNVLAEKTSIMLSSKQEFSGNAFATIEEDGDGYKINITALLNGVNNSEKIGVWLTNSKKGVGNEFLGELEAAGDVHADTYPTEVKYKNFGNVVVASVENDGSMGNVILEGNIN